MANYNLDVTYQIAVQAFSELDPKLISENSNTQWDSSNLTFRLNHIGQEYIVKYPEGDVLCVTNKEISMHTKILILHYLTYAKGVPLQSKPISYKELPDGAIYIEPFTRRAIKPMLDNFGDNPEEFIETAQLLGGVSDKYGDFSFTINVFPNVPITYVIWAGDDEFPATGNILFDASASYYLPTEDYALVSSMVIWAIKMINSVKK